MLNIEVNFIIGNSKFIIRCYFKALPLISGEVWVGLPKTTRLFPAR